MNWKFFKWNNGRSIWNVDEIARMYVTSMNYYIVLKNGKEYTVTDEEYRKVVEFMFGNLEK